MERGRKTENMSNPLQFHKAFSHSKILFYFLFHCSHWCLMQLRIFESFIHRCAIESLIIVSNAIQLFAYSMQFFILYLNDSTLQALEMLKCIRFAMSYVPSRLKSHVVVARCRCSKFIAIQFQYMHRNSIDAFNGFSPHFIEYSYFSAFAE